VDCDSVPNGKQIDALIGLDISKNALKLAKRNKRANVVLGTAKNLPFKEGSFKTVSCVETIFFTGSDYKQALEEIKRASRKYIILTFQHKDSAAIYKASISDGDNIAKYKDGTEYAFFNEDDVKGLMREGFSIKKMKVYALKDLGIEDKNVPPETKAIIYVKCEKQN